MVELRFREVVHLIGHLRLGAGRYVVDLALEQMRRGASVKVVVSPDIDCTWATDAGLERELVSAGVDVVRNVDIFRRSLNSLLAAADVLAPHVSHAGTITNAHSAIPAAVARWAGAPVVVATCHGVRPDRPGEQDLQDALAYAGSDAVTTPSARWADVLRRRLGVRKPVVIPVGLDLGRYPPTQRSGRPPGRIQRVVTVCELSERKGVDILIDSMGPVWQRFPEVELHIIGDGDRAASLREQASRLDRIGRIRFLGFVAEPYSVLKDYDLFALASRSDNMPVAIMEAMLAGLPVLATAVGGIPETVQNSGCGLLAPEPSVEAVGDTMLKVIERDTAELRTLGIRGEAYARSRFSVTLTADRLAEVYRRAALACSLVDGVN